MCPSTFGTVAPVNLRLHRGTHNSGIPRGSICGPWLEWAHGTSASRGAIKAAGIFFTVDTGYGVGRVLGFGLDAPFTVQNGFGDAKIYSSAFVPNVEALYFEVDFSSLSGWQEGTVLRLTDFDFLETPSP